MKEYIIYFRRHGEPITAERSIVILDAAWKYVKWLLLNALRCYSISIFCTVDGSLGPAYEDS